MLPFNFRAMCCISNMHMFLIWTVSFPAGKQSSGLAGTRSSVGQRPRAYILVRSSLLRNQKPGSGQPYPWPSLIRLGLHLSTTQRVHLTFQLVRFDLSLFSNEKVNVILPKSNSHESIYSMQLFLISSTARFKQQSVRCVLESIFFPVFQISKCDS